MSSAQAVRIAGLMFVLSLTARSILAEESLWQTDFAPAQTQAKAEHKYILLEFTGSDWCPPCKALKQEVFDLPEFQTAVAPKFVLVEIDFPKDKEIPEQVMKQNEKLAAQFQYRGGGFPTVLVLDEDSHVITKTGYRTGGVKPYLQHLDEIVAIHTGLPALRKQTQQTQGTERAKLLDKLQEGIDQLLGQDGWQSFPDEYPVLKTYIHRLKDQRTELRKGDKPDPQVATLHDWIAVEEERLADWQKETDMTRNEIPRLDPDNQAGLKSKYEQIDLIQRAAGLQDSFDDLFAFSYVAPKLFERATQLPGLDAEQKQWALYWQAKWYSHHFDYASALPVLDRSLAAAPRSAHADEVREQRKYLQDAIDSAKQTLARLRPELEKTTERAARVKLLIELNRATTPVHFELSKADLYTWEKELVELDDADSTHRRESFQKINPRLYQLDLFNLFLRHKYKEAEALCDKELPEKGWSDENLQLLHLVKAICCYDRGDLAACREQIRLGLALGSDSETAKSLNKMQDRLNTDQRK